MNEKAPSPITLRPDPVVCRLSPLGFQMWATQFLEAAKAVQVQGTDKFSPVQYFLTCRTIELALKAHLLARGYTPKKLKGKIGHNLYKALKKAQGESLADFVELSDAESEVVKKASGPYRSKRFEYFEVLDALKGFPERPDTTLLLQVAERLAIGVHASCEEFKSTT